VKGSSGEGSTSTNVLFWWKSVDERCTVRVLQKRVLRARAMHFVPRTAPVWHPIEELSACIRITAHCTDKSLSMRERLWSPPVVQFRAEASEGFQGAGSYGSALKLPSTRKWRRFPQSSVIKSGLKGDHAVTHWTYPEGVKKGSGAWPSKWFNGTFMLHLFLILFAPGVRVLLALEATGKPYLARGLRNSKASMLPMSTRWSRRGTLVS